MGRYSSFDGRANGTVKSKTVKRSISRKCDDGVTRSYSLPEG